MTETNVLLSLHRINAGIRKRIEAVHAEREPEKRIGVNGLIMGYLAENADRDVYQRDIERELCICRSAVSKMLASLEQGGLVTRERVARDDRLKRIVLTESGKAYTEQIRTDNRNFQKPSKYRYPQNNKGA